MPKHSNGLYKVTHEEDEGHIAQEVLTLDQFHCQIGHIFFEVAQKLIDKNLVTSVKLETISGEPPFVNLVCM